MNSGVRWNTKQCAYCISVFFRYSSWHSNNRCKDITIFYKLFDLLRRSIEVWTIMTSIFCASSTTQRKTCCLWSTLRWITLIQGKGIPFFSFIVKAADEIKTTTIFSSYLLLVLVMHARWIFKFSMSSPLCLSLWYDSALCLGTMVLPIWSLRNPISGTTITTKPHTKNPPTWKTSYFSSGVYLLIMVRGGIHIQPGE